MIFEALQSEQFRFKFYSLGSKILKFPEFNLLIINLYKVLVTKWASLLHLMVSDDHSVTDDLLMKYLNKYFVDSRM